jgi:polar amino acid transport system ATP-binding protein
VLLLIEEILGLQTEYSDITITLAYSEKDGGLELIIDSVGTAANPLAEGGREDDIGLKLIMSRCEESRFKHENGKNNLWIKVKKE